MLSALYAIYSIYIKLVSSHSPQGFAAIIVAIIFLAGVQLFFMGVIGEYVGRLYEASKARPVYIVADRIGAAAAGAEIALADHTGKHFNPAHASRRREKTECPYSSAAIGQHPLQRPQQLSHQREGPPYILMFNGMSSDRQSHKQQKYPVLASPHAINHPQSPDKQRQ